MRILEISGWEDYGMLNFENEHGGINATEVMDNIQKYQPEEEGIWTLKVHEVEGEISIEAASLIKSRFIDHDHKKHQCFFVEGEIIKS